MILVTGGTGLVGSHLLYQLITNKKKVRAIYRDKEKIKFTKNIFSFYTENYEVIFNKIDWVQADITETPSLEIAFKNIKNVYHCAADLSFNIKNYKTSIATNVIGTANIVNFCLSENIQKLCYVSSIATVGEDTKKPITETTLWNSEKNKNNIYAITKYNAELEVWRASQEGLNVVIINPGVIFGAGFWNKGTGEIFTKIDNGFKYYTSGNVGVIDVNDVVKAMIFLMNSEITNERFIAVSENITYYTLIQLISASLGKNESLKFVKKWEIKLVYLFEKIKYTFTKGNPSLSNVAINASFKTLNYDASKLKNVLSFKATPFTESIQNITKHYLKNKAT